MIWRDRPRSGASHQLNSPGSMLILSRGPTPKQIRMFFGENGNLVQYRLTMVNAYYLTMCYHNKHTITLRMYIYIYTYLYPIQRIWMCLWESFGKFGSLSFFSSPSKYLYLAPSALIKFPSSSNPWPVTIFKNLAKIYFELPKGSKRLRFFNWLSQDQLCEGFASLEL